MGIKYGSLNVDEKYASILEPNLFADSFLSPGVTYTDQYEEGAAGGIYADIILNRRVSCRYPFG